MKVFSITAILFSSIVLLGCSDQKPENQFAASKPSPKTLLASTNTGFSYEPGDNIPATAFIEHNEIYNPESVIPPQCYTKTERKYNPCYACHQTYKHDKLRTNQMKDGELQGEYQFSDLGMTNHWKNLFVDRTELIKSISDEDIQQWVLQDNYTPFMQRLQSDPNWKGEVTPIANLAFPKQAFDSLGFAKDGSHWVAFNYKPFPSTFWPTNGSTGDVMIRLPKAFRELNGHYNQQVYIANLSLVEMTIKELTEISTPRLSEVALNRDLNGNSELETAIYKMSLQQAYLGDAKDIQVTHLLYPQDTEFLHTVRYLAVDENGQIFNAPRMKEVRYMKKHSFKSKERLASSYYAEQKEKHFEKLPRTRPLGDRGINNMFGWTINGYIEDAQGQLRHQNTQELAFCNGCHKTVGATLDQTFAFPRKVDGAQGWGYIDLAVQQDVPNIGESQGEFLTYMQRVGGGDEFRQNKEMLQRWFNQDGSVNADKVSAVESLLELIMPSAKRANNLNKAYLTIVKEQSYLFGRDATLTEASNVLEQVDESQSPLKSEHRHQWDMRLNWQTDSE